MSFLYQLKGYIDKIWFGWNERNWTWMENHQS